MEWTAPNRMNPANANPAVIKLFPATIPTKAFQHCDLKLPQEASFELFSIATVKQKKEEGRSQQKQGAYVADTSE